MTEQQCECDPLDHGLDCPLRRTEQHECEWYISGNGIPRCMVPGCGKALTIHQAESRLNAYETLKKRLKVIFDSIDDYLAPVTAKGTTKDEYVTVEASTLAWWMDAIEDILEDKNE